MIQQYHHDHIWPCFKFENFGVPVMFPFWLQLRALTYFQNKVNWRFAGTFCAYKSGKIKLELFFGPPLDLKFEIINFVKIELF